MSVASFDWNDHRINLVDTPGYADFRGEALLGLAAADLAVFVIDGVAGVQSQDVVLWRRAAEMGIPRIVFVNKLDRERSSFDRTLAQVREVFGSHADPTELPIGEESSFHGVTDVLTHHAFVYDSGHAEPAEVTADAWTIRQIAQRCGATYEGWRSDVVRSLPRRRWWQRARTRNDPIG